MKLIRCSVINFASYDKVDLDFSNPNLTLIHGHTGSGKSTLMDLVCWGLYGVTAKNGSVDEIRSWNHPKGVTSVTIEVEVKGAILYIRRTRGHNSSQNDLYWSSIGTMHRGKNLNETQELLEQILDCTSEQYITGAYLHEFSKTAGFFTAKAKDRRSIFENIAELELATRVAEATSEAKTTVSKEVSEVTRRLDTLEVLHKQVDDTYEKSVKSKNKWFEEHAQKIRILEEKSKNFEIDKDTNLRHLVELHDKWEDTKNHQIDIALTSLKTIDLIQIDDIKYCGECGAIKDKENRDKQIETHKKRASLETRLEDMSSRSNPYDSVVRNASESTNEYDSLIKYTEDETNPFLSQIHGTFCDKAQIESEIITKTEELELVSDRLQHINTLQDLSYDLRGYLLNASMKQVEENTNEYLRNYFDAALSVVFTLDSDDLNTQIYKNGNSCVYSQLSKGQRCLLKLAFSVSVMGVIANSKGIAFNTLFFDESLEGLDSTLKVKAFRLFEHLSTKHDNIFVIDHSPELKHLFSTSILVAMENDISHIVYE